MKLFEAIHGQSLLSSGLAKVAIFMKCNTEQMLSKVKQSKRSNVRRSKFISNLNCILKSLMFPDSPELLVTPEDVSGDLGQEAVIQCLADGNPSPSYKWFRNDNRDMVSQRLGSVLQKHLPRP